MNLNISRMEVNIINRDIYIWSAVKCVFCNTLLEEKSKMLECLHIACNNCIDKMANSSKYTF